MSLHKRNCWTCENLNIDSTCAVQTQNSRVTDSLERAAVTRWQESVQYAPLPNTPSKELPVETSDFCPGYTSDDPEDYPSVSTQIEDAERRGYARGLAYAAKLCDNIALEARRVGTSPMLRYGDAVTTLAVALRATSETDPAPGPGPGPDPALNEKE